MKTLDVELRRPHPVQLKIIESKAKRRVVKAGRRGGKTTCVANIAVQCFLDGQRVLYAAPTQDQMETFWWEVKKALNPVIDAGVFYKNESTHTVELAGTKQRIRAKTAWNADTLRGDYCSLLILDEWSLMDEKAWELVGAPMLLDTDGDAIFIFTPPSIRSRSISKARDKQHASKLFKRAQTDTTGRWEAFHFTSHDNPYLNKDALSDITQDMSQLAIRQEILAEDADETPGALWTLALIDKTRVTQAPDLTRIVVGVDPHASVGETGIVVAGIAQDGHVYVLEDLTIGGSPSTWAGQAIAAYHKHKADRIIVESNNGGDMVIHTLESVDDTVPTKKIWASRGKATRAEPIVAKYENGTIHHVGYLPDLEEELTNWVPGEGGESPNRLDACTWTCTELAIGTNHSWEFI
jgi:hypothetical protein